MHRALFGSCILTSVVCCTGVYFVTSRAQETKRYAIRVPIESISMMVSMLMKAATSAARNVKKYIDTIGICERECTVAKALNRRPSSAIA